MSTQLTISDPLRCFEPGCTNQVRVENGYLNEEHPSMCDACWLACKANWNPKDCWQTPLRILDLVDAFYNGEWFDPCPANPQTDGLKIKWPHQTFINPPFSEYLKWARHGVLQPLEQIWICHHDSSTQRFQTLLPGATLCLLFERVSFIDPEYGVPRGTDPAKSQTLIYRGNHPDRFQRIFREIGWIGVEATP